jgi:hypothetical protein
MFVTGFEPMHLQTIAANSVTTYPLRHGTL